MQLTQQQADELRTEVKRTFYAATKLRLAGDTPGYLRLASAYCRRMADEFDIIPVTAMSMLAGAGMDAVLDILGPETAAEDLGNALYELELDGE